MIPLPAIQQGFSQKEAQAHSREAALPACLGTVRAEIKDGYYEARSVV